jgi:hypothetical protein
MTEAAAIPSASRLSAITMRREIGPEKKPPTPLP